jgi:hypothetical protein
MNYAFAKSPGRPSDGIESHGNVLRVQKATRSAHSYQLTHALVEKHSRYSVLSQARPHLVDALPRGWQAGIPTDQKSEVAKVRVQPAS